MKRILYLTLVILAFSACKKHKEPVGDPMHSYWMLEYTSLPYSLDRAWKPITTSEETLIFLLGTNDSITARKGWSPMINRGKYTLMDSAGTNLKILLTSDPTLFPQKVYLRLLNNNEMVMDSVLGVQSANYVSRRFGRPLRYD